MNDDEKYEDMEIGARMRGTEKDNAAQIKYGISSSFELQIVLTDLICLTYKEY